MSEEAQKFVVYGETDDSQLLALNLDMGTLLESYVRPYESGGLFILDGVSVDKKSLRRFKVVQPTEYFMSELDSVGYKMRGHTDDYH